MHSFNPSTMDQGFDLKFKLYEKKSLGGVTINHGLRVWSKVQALWESFSWGNQQLDYITDKKQQLDYIVQIHLAHVFISVAGLFLTIEIDWTLIESVSNLTCVDMYPSGLGMSTSQPSL